MPQRAGGPSTRPIRSPQRTTATLATDSLPLRLYSRAETEDTRCIDQRRDGMSAEEDELSDDASSSAPLQMQQPSGSKCRLQLALPLDGAGSTHRPTTTPLRDGPSFDKEANHAPQSMRYELKILPAGGAAAQQPPRPGASSSRGSMQLHLIDSDSREPGIERTPKRDLPTRPLVSPSALSASSAPAPRHEDATGFVSDSEAARPTSAPSDEQRGLERTAAQNRQRPDLPSSRSQPFSASEGGTRVSPSRVNGSVTPVSPTDERLVPLRAREDLTSEEVDLFLDLIVKHQPATLSAEHMTRSVNALYDEWLAMCATNSTVAKPKKALMDEYDKIYKGHYGPKAAARARWIAEESARASLETLGGSRGGNAAAGLRGSESPSNASFAGDRSTRSNPQRTPPRSDSGSNDGQAQGSASGGGVADGLDSRKRKRQEDGSPREDGPSQRGRSVAGDAATQSEGADRAAAGSAGIAKVGRNGLAVLPPGLFDILRNHLRDDILCGLVPMIRNDLAEQTSAMFSQHEEMVHRLQALEQLARNQDLWIRRLIAQSEDWQAHADPASPWEVKKRLRIESEAQMEHAFRSREYGPGGSGPSQRPPPGSVAWPTNPPSPTQQLRRRADMIPPEEPRSTSGVPQRTFDAYDARYQRPPERSPGGPTPRPSGLGIGVVGERPDGEARGYGRPQRAASSREPPPPPAVPAVPPGQRDRHRHSLSVDDWRSPAGLAVTGPEGGGAQTHKYVHGSPHAGETGPAPHAFRAPPPSDFLQGQPTHPSPSLPGPPAGARAGFDSRIRRPSDGPVAPPSHRGGAMVPPPPSRW